MKKKILVCVLLFALIWSNIPLESLADETDDMVSQENQTRETISNLERESKETKDAIQQLQGEKQQTQSNVNNLQNQSSALQSTINGYSSKLNSIDEEISVTEEQMAEVSAEIVELDKQLQEARQQEKDRYELLKLRMQSTYENGGSKGLVRLLLESGSMKELLTKFEYINAIVAYDKRKISELKAIQDDIEAKAAVVAEKEAELDAYQEQLDEKHQELTDLTGVVKGQLNTTNNSLSSEKNKLNDYDQKLAELDKKMKALEAKTAAAQAALAQQIADRLARTKENTGGAYSASDNELIWLAATIQAESDGESYTGKLGVGSVIMNRVKSSAFPNDVISVITQPNQFAPYRSGKVEFIIANGPNSTCIRAAQEVLGGARIGDYLFFMTQKWADYYRISDYTMIGNHAFFYRWQTKEAPPEEAAEAESENHEEEAPAQEQQEEPQEEEQEEEHHEDEDNNDEEDHDDEDEDDDDGDE